MTVSGSCAFSKIFLTQLENFKFQAKKSSFPVSLAVLEYIYSEFITPFKAFPV